MLTVDLNVGIETGILIGLVKPGWLVLLNFQIRWVWSCYQSSLKLSAFSFFAKSFLLIAIFYLQLAAIFSFWCFPILLLFAVVCDSWGRKESDTTERLIWSDLIWMLIQLKSMKSICFLSPMPQIILDKNNYWLEI